MKKHSFLQCIAITAFAGLAFQANAQTKPLSQQLATTVIETWKDSLTLDLANPKPVKWDDQQGLVLDGIEGVWKRTANNNYYKYLQKNVDFFVTKEGAINRYKQADHNIAALKNGHALLTLYKVTGQAKYFKAATLLWEQLQQQARNKATDLYVAAPFEAEYAALIGNQKTFDNVANQFIATEKAAGQSANDLGWYGMALVDVLDYFPQEHPKHKELLAILSRYGVSVQKAQPSGTVVYALAKAVRNGYLPTSYLATAEKSYKIIQNQLLTKTSAEKVDFKGKANLAALGIFLQATNELEMASAPKPAAGKTVLLDSYFNNETKTDQSGNVASWHYKWDEQANGGFSFWATQFNLAGFKTKTLYQAPTLANLKDASVYIIVDPDFEKENPKPNFIGAADITNITEWVKAGGILVLMGNDAPNVELTHFNELANKFGVHFNGDTKGTVPVATNFETAKVVVPAGNEIFKNATNLFIKEYSSLKLSAPAQSILKDQDGDNVMSVTKYGKGIVYVIGDPWLYNEYVDGRKLPASYDNLKAGAELVNWLTKQVKAIKK